MKVAVFLGSSATVSPLFLSEIEQLGEGLAEDGHQVIYGGIDSGCMGALARGVLKRGGHLIGILTQIELGQVQAGLSEKLVAPTLARRKELMIELADAFVVGPGGLGTLDEALEVMTLKTLGSLQKPLFFYNFLGVWTPFFETLALLVEQRFVGRPITDLAQMLDNQTSLRENLHHAH